MTYPLVKAFLFRARNKQFTLLFLTLGISILFGAALAQAQQDSSGTKPINMEQLKSIGVLQANLVPVNPQTESLKKFYYEIKPGETITDSLWLVNLSESENSLKIYPVHEITSDDGKTGLSIPEQDGVKEISSWISLESVQQQLKPLEQKQIEIILSVPPETPHGTYKGAFAMEKFVPAKEGEFLNTSFRKAYLIEVNVTENPKEFRYAQTSTFNLPIYFWPALIIFAASLAYYFSANKRTKNHSTYAK